MSNFDNCRRHPALNRDIKSATKLDVLAHIGKDVEIMALSSGAYDGGTALAVLTSKSVVLLSKDWLRDTGIVRLSLSDIVSVEVEKGLTLGKLILNTAKKSFVLKWVEKQSADIFAEELTKIKNRGRMPLKEEPGSLPQEERLVHLERLASLYEKGVLTFEELVIEKQRLYETIPISVGSGDEEIPRLNSPQKASASEANVRTTAEKNQKKQSNPAPTKPKKETSRPIRSPKPIVVVGLLGCALIGGLMINAGFTASSAQSINSNQNVNVADALTNPSQFCKDLSRIASSKSSKYRRMDKDSFTCGTSYLDVGPDTQRLPNNLSIYARGSSERIQRVRLMLNVNNKSTFKTTLTEFTKQSQLLYRTIFGGELSDEVIERLSKGLTFKGNNHMDYIVENERTDWPSSNGFELNFVIRESDFDLQY